MRPRFIQVTHSHSTRRARSGAAAQPHPGRRPSPAAPQPPRGANAAVIATWNEMAVSDGHDGGMASPTNFNYYAFVHLAMYNAVVGITGEYELYRWDAVAPKGASPEAAAAAAAHRVLTTTSARHRSPPNLDARLGASLANVRTAWRGAGHPLRRSGREPHHRPPDERRPECGRDRSAGDGARGVAPDAAGVPPVHERRGSVA